MGVPSACKSGEKKDTNPGIWAFCTHTSLSSHSSTAGSRLYNPHFTEEETGSEKLRNLTEGAQPALARAGIEILCPLGNAPLLQPLRNRRWGAVVCYGLDGGFHWAANSKQKWVGGYVKVKRLDCFDHFIQGMTFVQ